MFPSHFSPNVIIVFGLFLPIPYSGATNKSRNRYILACLFGNLLVGNFLRGCKLAHRTGLCLATPCPGPFWTTRPHHTWLSTGLPSKPSTCIILGCSRGCMLGTCQ
ncbi:hypothetical protein EV126DRAFT_24111 [Verticillium dahliae]|nr:hypothetical protein EV126DRAFT_24111 [Verticillium dahliae]